MRFASLLLALSVLFFAGCRAKPEADIPASNTELKVEKLGTADGCTIYRFRDGGGSRHYFVRCADSTTAINPQTDGRDERIETKRR